MMKNMNFYQWIETLYLTWLTTFTSTVSPSLAVKVGPGNRPLTVTIGFVEHSLLEFVITTFTNLIKRQTVSSFCS